MYSKRIKNKNSETSMARFTTTFQDTHLSLWNRNLFISILTEKHLLDIKKQNEEKVVKWMTSLDILLSVGCKPILWGIRNNYTCLANQIFIDTIMWFQKQFKAYLFFFQSPKLSPLFISKCLWVVKSYGLREWKPVLMVFPFFLCAFWDVSIYRVF